MNSSSPPQARQSVALLLLINLFCYLDRYLITAVLLEIKAEFLAGEADPNFKAGLLGTAFLVSYMVTAPVFGWLADRWSRWKLIAISVALWTVACGYSGLAGSFMVLLLTRVFLGIGEAGYGPAAPTIISDLFPIERRGQMMSWFYVAIPVGSALGYMWGGWAATHMSWHWAFFLVVPPGIALAVWSLFMKEPRESRPVAVRSRKAGWEDYKRLFRIPSFLLNIGAQTALTFSIGGLSFWVPTYLAEERGIPLHHATFNFGMIVVAGGLISTLLGGWLADKLRKRFAGSYFLVSGCGMLLGFPATLGMIYAPFPLAWVFVFVAIFFLFLNTGPCNTAVANVTPASVRATAFAVTIFFIHALGDAISPPLIGWIRDRASWNTAFLAVSMVILLAGVTWLASMRALVRDTAAIEEEERLLTQAAEAKI